MSKLENRMVIGLVGGAGVGKDTVIGFLEAEGYKSYSLSNTLRGIISDLNLADSAEDRKRLIALGNSLRVRFGNDILALGAKIWIGNTSENRIVIGSIRHPAELNFLKKELDAITIGIEMPLEMRFRLIKERNRSGDPKTWDEFMRLVDRENGVLEPESGQQVGRCLELVDFKIQNDGSINQFHRNLEKLLVEKRLIDAEGHEGGPIRFRS